MRLKLLSIIAIFAACNTGSQSLAVKLPDVIHYSDVIAEVRVASAVGYVAENDLPGFGAIYEGSVVSALKGASVESTLRFRGRNTLKLADVYLVFLHKNAVVFGAPEISEYENHPSSPAFRRSGVNLTLSLLRPEQGIVEIFFEKRNQLTTNGEISIKDVYLGDKQLLEFFHIARTC